ncbi:AzlC family ABC transporter permease [Hansschlegelia zhihuaiae]|uniref:Branched-chain amino acid ABC transporter permease n=1 Tax=Hansschlegelia zhihuaiae TaxID=405005 RepID=A0A4Q0MMS3_9HYPH|nr:AzlC family ABC transporter permease [Hansschlegelia zhihuaiae]RXF75111.1 branched-chain amino acid ABC transporter permease [Hansschlegelia zhihuaiae]
MGQPELAGDERPPRVWALRGARDSLSTPGFVLFGSFVGFGAMTHDFGWPLWAAALSTALVWAAPAQLVLAGSLASGAGIVAAALAVTVSAVRLLPMVIAFLPVLRTPRTRLTARLLAAHYVAVTAWFEGQRRTQMMPRSARMPYFLGLANGLVAGSTIATAVGHAAAGALPTPLSVALLGLTPIYFLLSLERGAGSVGERLAILIGLFMAPVVGVLTPSLDLLLTGVVGGTAAFVIERALRRRRETP